jgi:hypothetical protein
MVEAAMVRFLKEEPIQTERIANPPLRFIPVSGENTTIRHPALTAN